MLPLPLDTGNHGQDAFRDPHPEKRKTMDEQLLTLRCFFMFCMLVAIVSSVISDLKTWGGGGRDSTFEGRK